MTLDDLGRSVAVPPVASRVVSLVPSLTEALASTRPDALVGATDWCTHPPDLDVVRVRGTKNPDVRRILDLRPDLVVANKEENRRLDVDRLAAEGIAVWVTDIESVPMAVDSIERLFDDALHWEHPAWLDEARRLWCGPLLDVTRRVIIPIWRDPWMVVGARTFTNDLVRRRGWVNVYGSPDHDRYPHVDVAELDRAGADVVLLPDEPYLFTATDGPEAFTRTPVELVSGRLLTWYGPSLIAAAGD